MLDHLIVHCAASERSDGKAELAAVMELRASRWRIFGANDMDQLRQRLLSADRISGFDLSGREFPLLYGVAGSEVRLLPIFRPLTGKSMDLLAQAAHFMGRSDATQFREVWTLREVAGATLDRWPADESGDSAARALTAGRFSDAASFLLDSAQLIHELCAFAERFGYLVSPAGARVPLRQSHSFNPHRLADPLSLAEMQPPGGLPGLPSTQMPASVEAVVREAMRVAETAEKLS